MDDLLHRRKGRLVARQEDKRWAGRVEEFCQLNRALPTDTATGACKKLEFVIFFFYKFHGFIW